MCEYTHVKGYNAAPRLLPQNNAVYVQRVVWHHEKSKDYPEKSIVWIVRKAALKPVHIVLLSINMQQGPSIDVQAAHVIGTNANPYQYRSSEVLYKRLGKMIRKMRNKCGNSYLQISANIHEKYMPMQYKRLIQML